MAGRKQKSTFTVLMSLVNTEITRSRKLMIIALVALGFSCILSQLVVIREFLTVFQGNELIIGLILCCWMLFTATGSKLGQYFLRLHDSAKITSGLFLLQGILPTIIIALLYILEAMVFTPGTTRGVVEVFIFCVVLLTPYCVVSGILFTVFATILSEISNRNSVSVAYSFESFGSAIAGILFGFFFVYRLKTFQILALLIIVNLVMYILLSRKTIRQLKTSLFPALLLVMSGVLFLYPVDRLINSLHFKNQKLVYTKNTPYGNVSVTLTTGQYNFYENGTLLFSTHNQQMQEESVHFALLQHPLPEKILVVSGGISGLTQESLKYKSVNQIDYLEINPWLVTAEELFGENIKHPSVRVITMDARKWIRKSPPVYDAIIVNTPDPSTAQINRYYTLEFFRQVNSALKPGGVFSVSLSSTVNYMSNEAKKINGVVYQTLKEVFNQVEVIPGERNYYIASQERISVEISNLITIAGIENEYVNPYYIDDDMLQQSNRQILAEIADKSYVINTDLKPQAYFLQIRYWLNIYGHKGWILAVLVSLVVLFLFVLKKINPLASGVFTGGFAGASAEFLILILFQLLFGYIYQMLGIIVAFYMLGLTGGANVKLTLSPRQLTRFYLIVQILLLVLVLLIPVIPISDIGNDTPAGWLVQALLFILTALIAFATGLEFNIASKLGQQKIENIAGNLYGIDLAGAAAGTLITSLLCFPLMGLLNTCLMIAALISLSLIALLISAGKYS